MAIYLEDYDRGMNFEALACSILKCSRADDPWGYANADSEPHQVDEECKMTFYTLIDVAIAENRKNVAFIADLLALKERVRTMQPDGSIDRLIRDMAGLLNNNGY